MEVKGHARIRLCLSITVNRMYSEESRSPEREALMLLISFSGRFHDLDTLQI